MNNKWWDKQRKLIEDEWDKPQKCKCPTCGEWVIVQPEDLCIPVEDLCEKCYKEQEEERRIYEQDQEKFYPDMGDY